MKHYVELDVFQDECAVCILSENGIPLFEGPCRTDPDAILCTNPSHARVVDKIVHESGLLSIWLTHELAKCSAPVVYIDIRTANKALSARMNKSDRPDADWLLSATER